MSKNYKNCLLAIFTYNNGINLKKTLDKKKTYFPIDILFTIFIFKKHLKSIDF